jgi:hypothetical protein
LVVLVVEDGLTTLEGRELVVVEKIRFRAGMVVTFLILGVVNYRIY